jgi:predicted transcriptional regulator
MHGPRAAIVTDTAAPTRSLTIELPRGTYYAYEAIAKREGKNKSAMGREIITAFVASQRSQQQGADHGEGKNGSGRQGQAGRQGP